MNIRNKVARLMTLLALVWCTGLSVAAQGAADTAGAGTMDDFGQYYTNLYHYGPDTTLLGRGINMGNMMEAGSGDGLMATGGLSKDSTGAANGEGLWSGGRKIQSGDFRIIREAGFKSVRIPMRWTLYTSLEEPWTVNPLYVERAKQVVDAALSQGLVVVVNVHHYVELCEGTGPLDQARQRKRLLAIWEQISALFPEGDIQWKPGTETSEWPVNQGGYPADRVVFELLNEPNKKADQYVLADIHEELLGLIRNPAGAGSSIKPQTKRYVMLGSTNWSGMASIGTLQIPEGCTAANTIITVHNYEPFHFTHQGANFLGPDAASWKGTRWRGSKKDMQDMTFLFDKVAQWNREPGRGFEIYLGEFGVFSGSLKAELLDDQKRWTAFMAREAEARGFSWGYWEFNQGFGAYNLRKKVWRQHLIEALIPAPVAAQVPGAGQ